MRVNTPGFSCCAPAWLASGWDWAVCEGAAAAFESAAAVVCVSAFPLGAFAAFATFGWLLALNAGHPVP